MPNDHAIWIHLHHFHTVINDAIGQVHRSGQRRGSIIRAMRKATGRQQTRVV